MKLIRKFDPWKGELYTCPEKYSFNPYTGYGHRCIYCYATYIPDFYKPRRKKNLLQKVERDLKKVPGGSIISISNSSDPYLPMDVKYMDTRKCLEVFQGHNLKVLIVTKSDLVLRDIDLLEGLRAGVTFSMTTLNERLGRKLEPNAPESGKRMKALEKLGDFGIPTGLRLDPIFPLLTEDQIGKILRNAKEAGVSHIVSSTFKPRLDSWERFKGAFPEIAERLRPLYFKSGERINNSWYLPEGLRRELMSKVKRECSKLNISFATCREGFPEMHTSKSCDGSHLIGSKKLTFKKSPGRLG